MIFSVQNSNLMYSVQFSPDLVQTQMRETVSAKILARVDIPIQVCHVLEVMRRDFNQHHRIQLPIAENQLGTTKNMEEAVWARGIVLPRNSWLHIVAQPLSLWGGDWISRKPHHNRWRLRLLRTNNAQNTSPQQPLQPRPALFSVENLQKFSAARQLFDWIFL